MVIRLASDGILEGIESCKCDGQLFRRRFKSILVGGESYLLELVLYIYRNPIRVELVRELDEYPWSSHNEYVSQYRK